MLTKWFHHEQNRPSVDDAERKQREGADMQRSATQLQARIDPLRKMIERIGDPAFWHDAD